MIDDDPNDLPTRANDTAERMLRARLEYTSVQRGSGRLSVMDDGGQVVSWFSYSVLGVPTGLTEGIVLGCGPKLPFDWLQRFGADTGASLVKLTRAVARPLPESPRPPQRSPHWTVVRRAARARDVLPLRPDYDKLLAGLGRHTRRNLRLARNLATAERLVFRAEAASPLLTLSERAGLARRTRPHRLSLSLIARLESYADQTGRPFRTAVTGPDGRVISYACGYFGEAAVAYMLYQLNDPAHNAIGPSLLHRGFLLEWLIGRGCDELVFVHGCGGILQHACLRQPLEEVWMMRRTMPAYVGAGLIGLVKPQASIGRLARLALERPAA